MIVLPLFHFSLNHLSVLLSRRTKTGETLVFRIPTYSGVFLRGSSSYELESSISMRIGGLLVWFEAMSVLLVVKSEQIRRKMQAKEVIRFVFDCLLGFSVFCVRF